MNLLRSFEIAVEFLTVFRPRKQRPADMMEVGRCAWAFPLAGALIGFILVVVRFVFAGHLPGPVLAILLVGLWIWLTGGLHLDGWADCWDALPAQVDPEQRLEIMKDSRLGAFGALGLVLLLGLKTASIASEQFPWFMLVVAPVIGRGVMVVGARGAGHRGEGMAAGFLAGIDERSLRWAAILSIAAALMAGWTGLAATGGAYLAALGFRRLAESRLGAINGDVLGAMCELSETVAVVLACVTW